MTETFEAKQKAVFKAVDKEHENHEKFMDFSTDTEKTYTKSTPMVDSQGKVLRDSEGEVLLDIKKQVVTIKADDKTKALVKNLGLTLDAFKQLAVFKGLSDRKQYSVERRLKGIVTREYNPFLKKTSQQPTQAQVPQPAVATE